MTVDFTTVTERQQQVWSLGDYGRVGTLTTWLGERLVRSLDVHSGERVLDVAAGNGNAALAAARRFADVLATDYVGTLLEEAAARAVAEGLALRTRIADAQALPFPDGEFDVVMSTIGAMFAPDQEAVAREMARVCRSGGRIGMANWTPDSMPGDLLGAMGRHIPAPPGLRPPVAWGEEDHVRDLLGAYCGSLTVVRRTAAFRFPSAAACTAYFRRWFGPTIAAFAAVGAAGADELAAELEAVFARHNTTDDGTLAINAPYLEIVATRT